MADPARFWNRIARRYAKRPVADEDAYQHKLKITRSYLRPDMNLLEIGCGTGSTALAHAPLVGHIDAIDFSEAMIGIARDKAAAAGVSNVSFRCLAIADLDAPAAAYDMVLGLSILHLLDDWRALIARVHALLRPGGLFVSSTACIADIMPLFRLVAPLGSAVGVLPRVSIFTAEALRAAITGAGFSIEHDWQPAPRQALFIVARKQ